MIQCETTVSIAQKMLDCRGWRPALFLATAFLSLAIPLAAQSDQSAAPDASSPTQGQPSGPELSLDQALAEAAASGADFRILSQSLGAARLQRSLDLAKQGLSLSATGAYTAADGLSSDWPSSSSYSSQSSSAQATLIGKAQAASTGSSSLSTFPGLAQSATAGLALSLPLSKLALSATQSLPPTSQTSAASSAGLTSVVPSTVLGLTASQTLWDGYPGGQYLATLEKSSLTLQGKELVAAQSRSQAVAKVKQAYVTMLGAQRDLGIKKQVLDKQLKLLDQLKAIFALKQASAIDLQTAQINARSAQIDAEVADKTLRLANERLAVLIGRPAGGRFSVADVPDPKLPAASVEEAIALGLQKRVDLAQFGISARSSRIDADLARALAQPGVSLSGGAGLAMNWSSPVLEEGALSLGAKLSMPILDSGAAELQARTAGAQADLYELQAAQLKGTIGSDIRDYFESAQLAFEKIDLARQSAELAEAQLELMKAQNQYGTATTQDMLTASVTAATAEVNYGLARNNYLLAELSLETAMGM